MAGKYRGVTPFLTFTILVYLSGALLYGIDTGSFGSLQALPSFLRKFGNYNEQKKTWALPSSRQSAMNSIPFAGQALGAFLSSFVVDWYGYKWTMVVLAIVQVVAVVIAPANIRGLLAGSMLLFNAIGNLWGAGMSRAYATEIHAKGWMIPTAIQFIPALLVLIFIWFTPESPRWLVLNGKKQEAVESLNKLRPKADVVNGTTKLEIEAIEVSLQEASLQEAGGLDQGKWIDLFKGNMLRRTWIAWSLFVFLQFTGIQFTNSHAASFYVAQGLRAKSFTYVVIGNALQIGSCLFQITMYDHIGRRPFAIFGGLLCFIFLSVVASLGYHGKATPTSNQTKVHIIIASIILTQTFARWAVTNAFVIGGEIGGVKMRKKVLASAGVVNMISAILVTSVTPYLMNAVPGSTGLGARVGWFFAAPSFLLFLFGVIIIPELKNRSLEEVDELFEARLKWAWQFGTHSTQGTGAKIAALQNQDSERLRKLSVASIPDGKADSNSDSDHHMKV